MTLTARIMRLTLAAFAVGSLALAAAVPASAQSSKCTSVYNGCMKTANDAYNQCVSNVEGSCDIWSYGSYAYMYCEDSISQIIYDDCGTTWVMVQNQCQTAYDNCLAGTTASNADPGDLFLRKPLAPAKLPVGLLEVRRGHGSSIL